MIKYVIPGRLRNTHSKIVAFLFILNSLNLYKTHKSQQENGEYGHYIVIFLSVVQGLLNGFKLSSFVRSKLESSIKYLGSENSIVERVANAQEIQNDSNIDRIFDLSSTPTKKSSILYTLYCSLVQIALICLNIVQILKYEYVFESSSKLLPQPESPLMIPFDTTMLSLFLIL